SADRVGPHEMPVERVLTGKHRARDTGADDHDAFGAVDISVVELTSGHERNPKRTEKPWRHRPPPRAQVLVEGRALHGELHAAGPGVEAAEALADVTPRHEAAGDHLVDARHFAHPALDVAIKGARFYRRPAHVHDRQVDREDIGVEPGIRLLE